MTAPRKVALVTGSATGAGRAIALRFAAQGLAVAVNYSRSEADARETLAAAERHGVPAIRSAFRPVIWLAALDTLPRNLLQGASTKERNSTVSVCPLGVRVRGSFFQFQPKSAPKPPRRELFS